MIEEAAPALRPVVPLHGNAEGVPPRGQPRPRPSALAGGASERLAQAAGPAARPPARKSRDHSAGVARSEMAISKVWKVPPCNTVILSSVIDTIRVPSLSTDPTQYRTPSSISM